MFRQYASTMAPYKYAGYPLLLDALTLPPPAASGAAGSSSGSSGGEASQQAAAGSTATAAGLEGGGAALTAHHFLSPEAAPTLAAAAELCWLTIAASRLNGEELTRAGGVALLGALLSRCVAGEAGARELLWVIPDAP